LINQSQKCKIIFSFKNIKEGDATNITFAYEPWVTPHGFFYFTAQRNFAEALRGLDAISLLCGTMTSVAIDWYRPS